MLSKTISFQTDSELMVELKEAHPKPAMAMLPDWFKKLKEQHNNTDLKTIRMCKPFFDSLSAGYFITAVKDVEMKTFSDNQGKEDYKDVIGGLSEHMRYKHGIRTNSYGGDWHPKEQLGGDECPYHKHNNQRNYWKFLNQWLIKTPPGYSCLFVPVLNEINEDFYTLSGIVDTDKFHEVNFPMVLFNKETTIKQGTKIVQVIPFKRENWNMKVEYIDKLDIEKYIIKHSLVKQYYYKLKCWSQKKWR